MGVTTSQAKALIHRAKGSFRRTWNGGKGLQALVFVVAALAKVPQLVKRLIQPAQDLAATSAGAPAATSSVVTTGERVTAAAVAVLVALTSLVGSTRSISSSMRWPTKGPGDMKRTSGRLLRVGRNSRLQRGGRGLK